MKNFEERLRRLEELSERIREPDLALEDAVAVFEEGVKLSKGLEKDLERIESKVEILLNQPSLPDGKLELVLFDSRDDE
ncbi:MAG: exodeoxyribonuclease VII small subunit [Spirochaetae bacterium HGW-Spirochaetae-7]|jgi:exodeoxyribonuclease VII small subunit|nr:MAG: exodeoxyribonuclease VII small subunit [Spirochaetae bacterium HGW-Spirochaetae-7]